MTLFRTTLWTGLSTLIKVIFSYVLWKIIAVYAGPYGVAVLEQFQNFIQICRSFSCSLSQGIIKYVSEYKDNEELKSKILSSSLIFYLIVSIIVTFILIIFSKFISEKIFSSFAYQRTIVILAISIILYTLNNLFLSILNGEMEIRKYVSCNIVNTLLSFIITGYLVIRHGVQGGIIGFSLNQSIVLIFSLYLLIKCKWFNLSSYLQGFDTQSIKKLAQFAIISFTPIVIVPLSLMISRQWIAHELSWEEAGYWQAIMRLSDGYLSLMELMLSVYFIPRFSRIKFISEFKTEVSGIYRLVIPVAFLGLCFVFLFKKQIVIMLYSKDFFPMLVLFKYQIIGDIARIGSWLLGSIMAARAKVKILVTTEIIFNLSYVLLTTFFVHYDGLIGAAIAFALNSIIYFATMVFFTIRCIRNGSFHLTSTYATS